MLKTINIVNNNNKNNVEDNWNQLALLIITIRIMLKTINIVNNNNKNNVEDN